MTLYLFFSLPNSRFSIQDLPEVVPFAEQNVERSLPGALEAGRIRVQVHSFFEPQPRATEDTVWTLRYILQVFPFRLAL